MKKDNCCSRSGVIDPSLQKDNMTHSPHASPAILILGLGNDILMDDAIGLRVIDAMKPKFSGLFRFEKCSLGGLDILEMISGHDHVVMIDAVKTDAPPGTVHFFTPDHFRQTVNAFSFHDINILDALKVGIKIGIPLPSRLDIIAVEIAEDLVFSERMSPELEEAFPAICLTVEEWMNSNLVNK